MGTLEPFLSLAAKVRGISLRERQKYRTFLQLGLLQGARGAGLGVVLSFLFCLFCSALSLPVRGQNYSPGNDPDTDNPTGFCLGSPWAVEGLSLPAREPKRFSLGSNHPLNPGESWRGGRRETGRKMFPSLPPPPRCII